MRTSFLFVFVMALDTVGAEITLRPFAEQQWVEGGKSGFIANFEYFAPEAPLLAELQVSVRVNFSNSVLDFGECALWSRSGGSRETLPLCNPRLLTFSTNAYEGRLVEVLGPKQEGRGGLVQGTNFITLIANHIPSLWVAGGKIRTTLSITGEFPSGLSKKTSDTEIRVRGLYPLVRIDWGKMLSGNFTLLAEGGLPIQAYEIQESTDLSGWKVVEKYKSPSGDYSFTLKRATPTGFYIVSPAP